MLGRYGNLWANAVSSAQQIDKNQKLMLYFKSLQQNLKIHILHRVLLTNLLLIEVFSFHKAKSGFCGSYVSVGRQAGNSKFGWKWKDSIARRRWIFLWKFGPSNCLAITQNSDRRRSINFGMSWLLCLAFWWWAQFKTVFATCVNNFLFCAHSFCSSWMLIAYYSGIRIILTLLVSCLQPEFLLGHIKRSWFY